MLYPNFEELVACKINKSKGLLPAGKSVKSTLAGNHHSPFRGQGLEFDSVREYVPGDDIRSIDWRVTARAGSPYLKIFREDRERQLMICIDMNRGMRFGTRGTFKSIQAAKAAAILGWQGLARHDCISACLFGDVPKSIQYFAPKKTKASFCKVLKALSSHVSEEHPVPLDEALKHIGQAAHTGSLIYIISDFMDLDNFQSESTLSNLNKRCDVVFIAVNDPSDKVIPPIGVIGFGSKMNKLYINTDSAAGRTLYEDQWEKNRRQLFQLGLACKIPIIELATESNIHRDLLSGLNAIAKRKKL